MKGHLKAPITILLGKEIIVHSVYFGATRHTYCPEVSKSKTERKKENKQIYRHAQQKYRNGICSSVLIL